MPVSNLADAGGGGQPTRLDEHQLRRPEQRHLQPLRQDIGLAVCCVSEQLLERDFVSNQPRARERCRVNLMINLLLKKLLMLFNSHHRSSYQVTGPGN